MRTPTVPGMRANIATPIVRANHVFLSSDYGTGAALCPFDGGGCGYPNPSALVGVLRVSGI